MSIGSLLMTTCGCFDADAVRCVLQVQKDVKLWPFTVVPGPDVKPLVEGMRTC